MYNDQGYGGGGGGAATTIEVSSRDVGRIIGRGGSRIRELQDMSGARIKIQKEEASADTTPIELSGNQDCQMKAKQLIEELCAEQSSYGGGGGGGRGGGGGGYGGGGGGYGGGRDGGGGGYGGRGGGY